MGLGLAMLTLLCFIIVINLIFFFFFFFFFFLSLLWCIERVREPLCEPNFYVFLYIVTQGEVCRQLNIFLTPG